MNNLNDMYFMNNVTSSNKFKQVVHQNRRDFQDMNNEINKMKRQKDKSTMSITREKERLLAKRKQLLPKSAARSRSEDDVNKSSSKLKRITTPGPLKSAVASPVLHRRSRSQTIDGSGYDPQHVLSVSIKGSNSIDNVPKSDKELKRNGLRSAKSLEIENNVDSTSIASVNCESIKNDLQIDLENVCDQRRRSRTADGNCDTQILPEMKTGNSVDTLKVDDKSDKYQRRRNMTFGSSEDIKILPIWMRNGNSKLDIEYIKDQKRRASTIDSRSEEEVLPIWIRNGSFDDIANKNARNGGRQRSNTIDFGNNAQLIPIWMRSNGSIDNLSKNGKQQSMKDRRKRSNTIDYGNGGHMVPIWMRSTNSSDNLSKHDEEAMRFAQSKRYGRRRSTSLPELIPKIESPSTKRWNKIKGNLRYLISAENLKQVKLSSKKPRENSKQSHEDSKQTLENNKFSETCQKLKDCRYLRYRKNREIETEQSVCYCNACTARSVNTPIKRSR